MKDPNYQVFNDSFTNTRSAWIIQAARHQLMR